MKRKQFIEMSNYSESELTAKLDEYQRKRFNLSLRHRTAPLKNPLELRSLRRDIARVKTLLRTKFNRKV
jgi:large subunit ribosomal protein L29